METGDVDAPGHRRTHSQPLANTDSESDPSEAQNYVIEAQDRLSTMTITARGVTPAVSTPKVIHPQVFSDISKVPIVPTTWLDRPQLMTCPKCAETNLSETVTRLSGTNVFLSSLCFMTAGLCALGLCCPCCMDTAHVCRHCKTEVGYRSVV
jgi:hypothetical protein